MKLFNTTARQPIGNRVVALAVALAVSATAIAVSLTWSAIAEPGQELAIADAASAAIDIDSLYTAVAAEEPTIDSSYAAALEPEREITGHVSWYGPGFHGRRTANGERFDKTEMTAAHKTLPFNTIVRVTDTHTGNTVLVRVNDRGPYVRGRVLDLSETAARRLGMKGRGTTTAQLEIFQPVVSEEEGTKFLTFNTEAEAVAPNGYSVLISQHSTFKSALDAQEKLAQAGYEHVFVTQIRENSEVTYRLTVGLFNSIRLSRNLQTELIGAYADAAIIQYEKGALRTPETEDQLAVATK